MKMSGAGLGLLAALAIGFAGTIAFARRRVREQERHDAIARGRLAPVSASTSPARHRL
jgi:hypothetical protein